MKNLIFYGIVFGLALLLTSSPMAARAMDSGIIGGEGHNGYNMGPGMMTPYHGSRDYGTGPCMLGRGFESEPNYLQNQNYLDRQDAERILEDYLSATHSSKLKLGEIKDIGPAFEADLRTKDNVLVNDLFVDKITGRVRSTY